MKKLINLSILAIFVLGLFAFNVNTVNAVTRVNGYTTKRGTYVAPSYRSSPNKVKYDNYSSKGNYNPYTGKKGYKNW